MDTASRLPQHLSNKSNENKNELTFKKLIYIIGRRRKCRNFCEYSVMLLAEFSAFLSTSLSWILLSLSNVTFLYPVGNWVIQIWRSGFCAFNLKYFPFSLSLCNSCLLLLLRLPRHLYFYFLPSFFQLKAFENNG